LYDGRPIVSRLGALNPKPRQLEHFRELADWIAVAVAVALVELLPGYELIVQLERVVAGCTEAPSVLKRSST
jgi:hypothetical protein